MASPPILVITPEHEILNFKQREGENLKDAWHRICNAQNISTRKLSTSVILCNFYDGLNMTHRQHLDCIAKENFIEIDPSIAHEIIEYEGKRKEPPGFEHDSTKKQKIQDGTR